MSKVIKGGTVVTADRTYKADVLIEGEKIAAIGDELEGRRDRRCLGRLCHPRRH